MGFPSLPQACFPKRDVRFANSDKEMAGLFPVGRTQKENRECTRMEANSGKLTGSAFREFLTDHEKRLAGEGSVFFCRLFPGGGTRRLEDMAVCPAEIFLA